MQGSSGGAAELPEAEPDVPPSRQASVKHDKTKGKKWNKMAWFSRKSKSRHGSKSDNGVVPEEDGLAGPSNNSMDMEASPPTSTSNSSPFHSRSLVGSSSSSESDIFERNLSGPYQVKKRYPNSEIVEQNCLRPSIARALFMQLDASTNAPNQRSIKHSWQRKKVAHLLRTCDTDVDEIKKLDTLSRTISMPSKIAAQSSNCHCAACCSCSPSERLRGLCPAYMLRSTSTSSLDTGLSNLEYSIVECSTRNFNDAAAAAVCGLAVVDNAPSTSAKCSPHRECHTSDQFKSNSLPLYYGQSLQRKCKSCGRCIRTQPSMHSLEHTSDFVPLLSEVCEDFCHCQHSRGSAGGAEPDACSIASIRLVIDGATKTESTDTDIETNNHRSWSDEDSIGPFEFKKRLEMMKLWFSEFSNEQKNLVLKELLVDCEVPQIHTLSLEMEPKLHAGCPPNCRDTLTWLPQSIALHIFSFLDPVSLCHASGVCRGWYQLANESSLWRQFCCQAKWRLSRTGEQRQILQHMAGDGQIEWKEVFAERHKLRYNWLQGKCNVRTFEGHNQGISCVQFDDTRIVSGSSDKTIKVWNIRTNSPWAVQTLVGHSGTVRCLHLDGNRLVSGSTDRTIKVWDLSTQQSWSSIACKVTMIGHTDTVRCLKVDDERVISGSYDKTLKVWDIRTGLCCGTLRGHDAAVLCVQFDESKIVSGSCDKTIKVWTFEGQCVMTLEGHHDAVTCLQYDSTRIISGSLDCNLKFWDIHTGRCLNTIDWKASEGHTGVVRCLQADSWRVVSASDDRTLKVWSLETGQRLVTLRNHTDGVTCLQFSDHIIVSGSYDKTVKLWDFTCC